MPRRPCGVRGLPVDGHERRPLGAHDALPEALEVHEALGLGEREAVRGPAQRVVQGAARLRGDEGGRRDEGPAADGGGRGEDWEGGPPRLLRGHGVHSHQGLNHVDLTRLFRIQNIVAHEPRIEMLHYSASRFFFRCYYLLRVSCPSKTHPPSSPNSAQAALQGIVLGSLT